VQDTCYAFLGEFHQDLQKIGLSALHLDREFGELEREIQKILNKTAKFLPDVAPIEEQNLAVLGSSRFPHWAPLSQGVQRVVPMPLQVTQEMQAMANTAKATAVAAIEVVAPSVSPRLQQEMCSSLTYHQTGTIIDADCMKDNIRHARFPNLYSLNLTAQEQKALIYTLHSQTANATNVQGVNSTKEEALARAVYSFQAVIDNPSLGCNEQARAWILHQIFTEKRIDTLIQSPDLLNKLTRALVQRGKELAVVPRLGTIDANKLQGGLFLLSLAEQVSSHPNSLIEQEIKDASANSMKELHYLIIQHGAQDSPRSALLASIIFPEYLGMFYDKIAAFPDTLNTISSQEWGHLLTALRYCLKHPSQSLCLQQKIERLTALILSTIKEQGGNRDFAAVKQYLSNISSEVSGEDITWDITAFPLLEADYNSQKIHLDLISGDIFIGDNRVSFLPAALLTDPTIYKLFPTKKDKLWIAQLDADNRTTTVYTLPEDKTIRIVSEQDQGPYIEKFIEGAWALYKRFPSQNSYLAGTPIIEDTQDLPEKVAQAMGDRPCFLSRDGKAIYAVNPSDFKLYATFSSGASSQLTLSTGEVLLEPTDKGLIRYSTFEQQENLLLMGQAGIVSKILYPKTRLHNSSASLSYDIQGGKVTSPAFPGYTLASAFKQPGLHKGDEKGALLPSVLPQGFTSYHLLEKDNGEQIVLLPHSVLQKTAQTHTISIKGAFRTQVVENKALDQRSLYEYTVNPETNRLQAASAEAYLQLAYICFAHQEYSNALFYMEKAHSGIGDTAQFASIFHAINGWEDASDHGSATKLRLLCFAERVRRSQKIEEKLKTKTTTEKAAVQDLETSPYTQAIQDLYTRVATFNLKDPLSLKEIDKNIIASLGIAVTDGKDIQDKIAAIEKTLASSPEDISAIQELAVTPLARQTKEIVGHAYFEAAQAYFTVTLEMPKKVETDLFTRLQKAPNTASTKRLAGEHLHDFEIAQRAIKKTATITKENASRLKKELNEKIKQTESEKESALRNALAFLEKTSAAGESALFRKIGLEESSSMESLIQIWRSGHLLDPKNKAIQQIAKRKIHEEELKDIEWEITKYMAAVANLKHIQETKKATKAFLSSFETKKDGDANLAQHVYELVSSKRHYALYTQKNDLNIQDIASIITRNKDYRAQFFAKLDLYRARDKISDAQLQNIKNTISKFSESQSDVSTLSTLLNELPFYQELESELLNDPRSLRELCQLASDKDYKELLSIEHACQIILRESQVSTLRDMLSSPNAVRQLGMGGGKSKVLLPLLAKRKATGHNLVAILLPEALYETGRRNLDSTNRDLFGQEMFCFEFNRFSSVNAQDLQEIYLKLLSTIESKGFIACDKKSLLSFRNTYISLVNQVHKNNRMTPQQRETIQAMAKIALLFKEKMDVLADEVDLILDVRKEVNFAVGDRLPIQPVKVDMAFAFLSKIAAATPAEGPRYKLQQKLLQNAQSQIPLNERREILYALTEEILEDEKIIAQPELISYLKGQSDTMPDIMDQEHSKDIFNKLSSLKAILSIGFSATLGKTNLVDYGRDPHPEEGTEPFTIPYMSSNTPAKGSQFNEDIERICYTLQDYFYKPVDQVLVRKSVNAMVHAMYKEFTEKNNQGQLISYPDTNAYQNFTALLLRMDPQDTLGLVKELTAYATVAADSKLVKKLTEAINSSPLAKLVFCQEYTLKQRMKVFPEQISSKADDLADMTHGFGGFTGTPWSRHTFHDKIDSAISEGVDGNTYSILLHAQPTIHVIEYNPAEPLSSFKNFGKTGYKALIDTGAYLKGVDNYAFIQQQLVYLEDGYLGIYYDISGTLVGQKKGQDPVPLDQISEEDLEKRITLYDQSHTTGADVRQLPTATAAVTIGESTTIRDLFQAVWRLRQLDKGQKIEFYLSQAIKELINPDQDLTTENILDFCLKNQSQSEGEVNFRAEANKIKLFGPQVSYDQLVQRGSTLDETNEAKFLEIAYTFIPLLVNTRDDQAIFRGYAQVSSQVEPALALDQIKERVIDQLDKVIFDLDEDSPERLASITAYTLLNYREKKPMEWMPENVPSAQGDGAGEADAEAEVAVEVQQIEVVEQEPVEEVLTIINPTAGSGQTVVTGNPVKHQNITLLCTRGNDQTVAQLQPFAPLFGPEFFIGKTYEGRIQQAINSNQFMPANILHAERLPIHEALFVYANNQWKVIFGSTHDSYPSFSSYPRQAQSPAASLVAISEAGPISITDNEQFRNLNEEQKKAFLTLYVQLKLFSGHFNYTAKELGVLKEWITADVRKQEIRNFFEQSIRPTKSVEDQKGYSNSPLRKLFDQIAKEGA
jgi:hypothetical protein